MRSTLLALILVSPVAIHLPGTVAAEDKPEFKASVKPSILHGSAEDVTAGAVRFNASVRYDHALGVDDNLSVMIESKGAIATDARANSENLYAALFFGYDHQFADREKVASTKSTSDSTN